MIQFVKVSTATHIKSVAKLAHAIWHEHYPSIIGIDQVNYMVEKFQSAKAISDQLNEGFEYYLVELDNDPVGYLSVKKEAESLFLSKIYVLSNQRGKGLGKSAFSFIEAYAKNNQCSSIYLTVNIHNKNSISAYEKLGYQNIGAVVKDIGNGFVMDDYKMLKTLH